MPSADKFTLYWLDESRTQRLMWLLELLELDYEVDINLRDPETWRGSPELFQVHPLGKAPILEIKFADGRPDLQLAESGLIFQYLLEHYDKDHELMPRSEREQLEVNYYIHYCEGTLQPILLSMLINATAKRIAPFGLKTLAKLLSKGINYGYYLQEFRVNLLFLDMKLRKQGTGYFVGDRLTAADVMLSFPIYENIYDNLQGVKEVSGEKDLVKKYPRLAAWSDMVKNDPIYLRITEVMQQKVNELYIRNSRKD